MKRRIVAMLVVLDLIVPTMGAAAPQERRASDYLSSYAISLAAIGDGKMEVYYNVDGLGLMDKVGADAFYIYAYEDGIWVPYEEQFGIMNPDFYSYDAPGHIGFTYFDGEIGTYYYVTLQAYARGYDGGSDIGFVDSSSTLCQ